jgi:hypothetical protein
LVIDYKKQRADWRFIVLPLLPQRSPGLSSSPLQDEFAVVDVARDVCRQNNRSVDPHRRIR